VTLRRTGLTSLVAAAVVAAGCSGGHEQAYRDVVGKGPLRPAPARRNGLIAFVRAGSLYGIRPNGTGRHQLLDGGPYYAMAWSPDGSRVVLDTISDIVLRQHDGSGTRTILHQKPSFIDATVFMDPAWSPDGNALAIDEAKGSIALARRTVELMRLDGRLHEVAEHSAFPSWGPDGRLYYERRGRIPPFETTGQTYDALHVRDWKGDRELARDVHLPAVSPDGRELVAQRSDTRAAAWPEIWVVHADGTGAHRLVAVSDSVRPAWLPAG